MGELKRRHVFEVGATEEDAGTVHRPLADNGRFRSLLDLVGVG